MKTVASDGTQNDATVSIYTSLGDEKSTQLFEFLSNNSDVEWSQTKTTTNGNEVNYITTVNWDGGEPGQTMVADRIINQNNTIRANNSILGIQSPVIREVNHNHPNGNRTVSVGDVNVATMTQTAFPNTKFHNYTKQYGYTPYNMFTEPAILQEVIIYGKKR